MPLRSYKATSPGHARDDPLDVRGDHHQGAVQAAARAADPRLRPEQRRPPHRRHRGGGEKQHYRIIDFKRDKVGVPARLATIEYDPNRSARIGLLHYRDGEKRYMLLPHGLKVGDVVMAGPEAEARVGNALPIANIPLGTTIHNIELVPGKGGQIVRSAGRPPSCSPRKATTPRSACRRARSGGSASAAWPPSARSATSTTRTRTSARPAAPATWASGPRSAASS